MIEQRAEVGGERKDEHDEHDSRNAPLQFAMTAFVQSMLAGGDGPTEPYDGVGKAGGVAKE